MSCKKFTSKNPISYSLPLPLLSKFLCKFLNKLVLNAIANVTMIRLMQIQAKFRLKNGKQIGIS